MTRDSQQVPPMFHIDVSANGPPEASATERKQEENVAELLQQLLVVQRRQVELLEDLVQQSGTAQKQRAIELSQWKQANPALAQSCRRATETLTKVQTEFLESLTDEVMQSGELLMDSDFVLNEFVDRFGPRLAHLNGVLQVISQLSSVSNPPGTSA